METRSYVPAVLAAMWIFVPCGRVRPRIAHRLEVGTNDDHAQGAGSRSAQLSICLGPSQNRRGWFRTLRNLNPRLQRQRADRRAGEKLHLPSMLVPKYVAQCAGESPLLARARELQDAGDEKPSRLADALQEGAT
jgi:membrane-bound lytic murein transglycosylase D